MNQTCCASSSSRRFFAPTNSYTIIIMIGSRLFAAACGLAGLKPQILPAGFQQVSKFGQNPTNLDLHVYVPAKLAPKPAVILAVCGPTHPPETPTNIPSSTVAGEAALPTPGSPTTSPWPSPRASSSCTPAPSATATAGTSPPSKPSPTTAAARATASPTLSTGPS